MGIQADIMIPPIIIGILIIMIFTVKSFILDTSIDNRLNNEVQSQATVSLDVIQEEVRGLKEFQSAPGASLRFVRADSDTVMIDQVNRDLRIITAPGPISLETSADTTYHALNIANLQFSTDEAYNFADHLRVHVETESRPEQHARFREDKNTVRAISEKKIFLRHIAAKRIEN